MPLRRLADGGDAAEVPLLKVLKAEPENRDARLLMALSRLQQGRHNDAAVVLDDLMEDNPRDETTLLLAAGAYAANGGYAKAMEALDKAMKANPQRPAGYYNMSWLLLDINPGKTDEAEMYYRKAVQLGGPSGSFAWGIEPERGLNAQVQSFERGVMFYNDCRDVYVLYGTGRWQKFSNIG